ncbi:oxidative stress-induced growth inhibitor 1-like [Colletes gigas]|uniref:oxidative stress-induced growth inhibitor 1-like n=1 Tax=Colletes gigas TaxID=935657 RepID=UPI001C9B8DB0|nr:oxidative stress-induced growth inhibitor 1-like [Colletes gigas]XP_043266353.1 oxidative stress-induced growth inhibitor 1-like [Colletes gigas]XP_043266361.1 oxidative stress-induced growth inhibitor 1-like [Colletes gigas]
MLNCYNDDGNDVVYKDVVVIGNGPSGICLSYLLAGNWPYYTGEPHPGDEMLTARLHFSTRSGNEECCNATADEKMRNGTGNRWQQQQNRPERCETKSQGRGLARSTRCKLECLSSGLEGRIGGRPLAVLMDQLQHPCVDAGLDLPSLLTWKSLEQHPEHKVIDHVVLGKGQPGGAWQTMDPNVLTISLNRWMSFPDLEIREWEKLIESEQHRLASSTDDGPFQEKLNASKTPSRISVGTVAAYYKDYVRRKGLEQYFQCGTTVTSVRPVRVSNVDEADNRYGWMVEGFENNAGKLFRYRCKRVVLATGTTDLSNRLGIPGDDSRPDWVTHDLNDLESRLDRLVDQHHDEEQPVDPVLVIGSGLSAADAIIAARFRGIIPVLHAFRDSSTEWSKSNTERIHNKYDRLQGLPSSMYPEYHKVYEMMADGGTNYPLYKALKGYTLVGFGENRDDSMDVDESQRRMVTLLAPDGQLKTFRVSVVAILIGYKPDLSYVEADGIGLGKFPDKPIDGKSNPIEVDDFTYEVTKAPRTGLYALGPLVGDNFVRYLLGGAFGILAHILNTSAT